ncbi:hypothetical protein HHK36_024579 [Tetracentron sinense]|uniref:Uncharacterized protein n=1 Tax=Tetracentron sinense TaxID=13715 RepID=A0A835D4D6_TETSI|nr:hypothetical protein HHK36_024579 [Tetracentron sinense]
MVGKGQGGRGGKAGGGGRNSKKIGMSLSVSGAGGRGQKCTATLLLGNGNKSKGGAAKGKNSRKCGSCSGRSSACVGGPKGPKRKAAVTLEDYGSSSSQLVQVPSVMEAMGMMIGREAVQSRAHEKVSKACFENKKNGCYSRLTTKEKVSSHDFIDFYSGRVGTKEDVKVTSTLKFGDKAKGYSGEFVTENKYQKLKY